MLSKIRNSLLSIAAGLLLAVSSFAPRPAEAAYAFVQQVETSSANTSSLAAPPITPTAGHSLIIMAVANGGAPLTLSDGGVGNTYTFIRQSTADIGNRAVYVWIASNVSGSPTTITVTGSAALIAIAAQEFSGLATTSPVIASATAAQNGPGTGANIISSGNVAVTSQPAMLWAFEAYEQVAELPAAGTGFTAHAPVWSNYSGANAGAFSRSEDLRLTATGSDPGTFGVSSNGQFGTFTTIAIAFAEAPSPPFAPILLDNAAHTGASDQINMGSGPGTGTGDTAQVAFTKLKQWAADVNAMATQFYPVRSVQTPVTGFAIAASTLVTAGAPPVTQLMLNPAATLAAGTVTLPQNPGDNQPFALMTSQTITALTVNTADATTVNGAPTTQAANTAIKWRFVASLNKWFREQ